MGRPFITREWRVCPECGEEFEAPRHASKRFCSRKCSSVFTGKQKRGTWTGAQNPRYNNGLCVHQGRTIINCRDGTLMFYYRGLLAAKMGRLLEPHEIVHHINGDESDDRLENLAVVTRAEHVDIHRAELQEARRAKTKV